MKRDWTEDWEMCKRATPGPWKVRHRHKDCIPDNDECIGLGLEIIGPPKPHCWAYASQGQFARSADAKFIAEAREALPYWLERAWELERAIKTFMACAGWNTDNPKGYGLFIPEGDGKAVYDLFKMALNGELKEEVDL